MPYSKLTDLKKKQGRGYDQKVAENQVTNTKGLEARVMVFNATFNNISAISSQSVFMVEKTGVPGENHRHVASH